MLSGREREGKRGRDEGAMGEEGRVRMPGGIGGRMRKGERLCGNWSVGDEASKKGSCSGDG